MIGAMPAVAVRHERRKNKTKDKPVRPTKLQIQQMKAAGAVINEALSPGGGAPGSENGSHVGSPVHVPGHLHPTNGDIGVSAAESTEVRYGDECFYGKVSLLHFIVFFLLGGLTVLIVGAVQFKKEAGLAYLRYHFLVAGLLLIGVGCLLLVIKCACYRIPLPDEEEDEDELEKEEEEKKKLSPNLTGSPAMGNVIIDTNNIRLSPSKDSAGDLLSSSSRRASRGDVVQHHVVVKTTDETRSLLTLSTKTNVVDSKNDVRETVLMTTSNNRRDSGHVIDQV